MSLKGTDAGRGPLGDSDVNRVVYAADELLGELHAVTGAFRGPEAGIRSSVADKVSVASRGSRSQWHGSVVFTMEQSMRHLARRGRACMSMQKGVDEMFSQAKEGREMTRIRLNAKGPEMRCRFVGGASLARGASGVTGG